MKRFEFRLQKVLETKQRAEDLRKRELGRANREMLNGQHGLVTFENERNAYQENVRAFEGAIVSVADLRDYADYFARMRAVISSQRAEVNRLARQVDEKRTILLETSKEKKVLERLREKRYFAYRKEIGRELQFFLDEIGNRGPIGLLAECGAMSIVLEDEEFPETRGLPDVCDGKGRALWRR